MILPILGLGAISLVISWLLTAMMIRVAPKIGLVDKPGHRKIHTNPKPLGGGIAIFIAFALPTVILLIFITSSATSGMLTSLWNAFVDPAHLKPADLLDKYIGGVRLQTPLALSLLGSMLVLHVMGLIDDRKALGPYIKLVIQLAAAGALVLNFRDMRVLTVMGYWPSVIITTLWIAGITNAFNFLDNMDGLSAGVAAVCTAAFLITAIIIKQWFVAATLSLLLGSLLGFLFWNFPPARIFMGDSGSLVIGFLLGVMTVRTTYLPEDRQLAAGWYSVFVPVIVLALPLYDLVVVSIIRMSRGKSPFVGDTNHFSHRLVARGMSHRTAVLCLYLVTAATAIAAILLPHVESTFGAILIFIQTILVLGVVALLEQHPLPQPREENKP